MEYSEFLKQKSQLTGSYGFKPVFIPDFLYDFQKYLVDWSINKGRSAIFADCGLGKTPIQLVIAENIVRKTNKNVLIITPLSVAHQTVKEGNKFDIECYKSNDGKSKGKITITNYERLHLYNPNDYINVICDESSILKNFDGARKKIITEFTKKHPYRLACTATAAPNDYIELGTTSEALGEIGFMDMLNRFFKNDQNTSSIRRAWASTGGGVPKWRFKKHAEIHFWRWVSSWSRILRKPSDIGFDDKLFELPELIENQIIVKTNKLFKGRFFSGAIGLKEQREELRETLKVRCEKVAELVDDDNIAVVWCHLNDEGDFLEKIIPNSVQVSGRDSDDKKEFKLNDFSDGNIRVLITKPKIAGFGLNWQHCNHTTWFPSHSFEQYYQGIRRFWRFGQGQPVNVDIVTTSGGSLVLDNLRKKQEKANRMFSQLIKFMNDSLEIDINTNFKKEVKNPTWL